MLKLGCAVFALLSFPVGVLANDGGYVVGNFGVSAQIAESDGLVARIKVNPPELGKWLQDFGEGSLWIEEGDGHVRRLRLRAVTVSRVYPEYRAIFDAEGRVGAEVSIFAPLGLNSATGFLPALIVHARLRTSDPWAGRVGFTLRAKAVEAVVPEKLNSDRLSGIVRGPAFLGLADPTSHTASVDHTGSELTVSAPVRLRPGSEKELTFIVGSFHPDGYYANEFGSASQLLTALANRTGPLERELREFEASLPATGDRAIDAYLRWYVSAGIVLTKGLRTGEVLTMGYRELNQRDSFWTSGIHLVFWKDLERKMLLETIQGQLPSGRIPVCLLPLIDRGDELDSAEYFVLRVARYYGWHRDKELLTQAWPAVKKAIAYLESRDLEKVGVPMQMSYWADWKDVPGVEGRKYAPHFALLWVATLKAASELAVELGDSEAAERYAWLRSRAEEFVNRPFERGGMWNGLNYVDLWKDGRRPNYVLQDQVVGAYFGVLPRERLGTVYRQLSANETAFGVRETFPYIKGFDPKMGEGDYHNGGVWPYLNFVDAAGRYAHGYAVEAERIIRKVGRADLEAEGDFQPGERMHGDTGRNLGFPIQAWNAALFSAIYFGAYGVERVSDSEIRVRVRTPRARDFSTRLMLPGAPGTLSSRSGKLKWKQDSSHAEAGSRIAVKMFDERKQILEAAVQPPSPQVSRHISRAVLEDKIRGGWAGQMIGVAYGAPTEFRSNGKIIVDNLRNYQDWSPQRIKNALNQDDLYVEMTFAEVMDKIGLDATTEQYGEMFRDSKYMLWHANAGARRNLNHGIKAPWSGHPKYNIHANDIDFQIESDFIGLMTPGMPREANKYADRVGRVMSWGDGLYGGMFFSGMYAAAFFESNPRKVVERGLLSIPKDSTYSKLIQDVLRWSAENPNDWRVTWKLVGDKWDQNDACPDGALQPFNIDAKLNGGYVALGLLYGKGDFAKTLEVSTRAGQDSDCNPSSAAGILGVMLGYERIPEVWKAGIPALADTKFEFTQHSFNSIVASTMARAEKVVTDAGGEVTTSEFKIPVQEPVAPKLEQWHIGAPQQIVRVDDAAWKFKGPFRKGTFKHWGNDVPYREPAGEGSAATLTFEGRAVAIVGLYSQDGGRADVLLDGRKVGEIDAWIPESTNDNDYWHIEGLPDGKHTLQIVARADAHERSEGTKLQLVNAVIYGESAP